MGHRARFLAAQKAKAETGGGVVGFVGRPGVVNGEFGGRLPATEEGRLHPLNQSFINNYHPPSPTLMPSPTDLTGYDPAAPCKTYETPFAGSAQPDGAPISGGYDSDPTHKTYETPAEVASWPPRPPELSTWPIPVRQAWADRTAELEAAGLDWREAERTAFAEVRAAVEGGAKFGPEDAPDAPPAAGPLPSRTRQTRIAAAS